MADPRDEFLAENSLAVVGVSRQRGFGNSAFRHLKKNGYRVFPVNRETTEAEGEKCYRSLDELPEPVGGVVIVVPPKETEQIVADCARLGIKKVWMQQGAESPEAIRLCQENGTAAVHGTCIMMYASPSGAQDVRGGPGR